MTDPTTPTPSEPIPDAIDVIEGPVGWAKLKEPTEVASAGADRRALSDVEQALPGAETGGPQDSTDPTKD